MISGVSAFVYIAPSRCSVYKLVICTVGVKYSVLNFRRSVQNIEIYTERYFSCWFASRIAISVLAVKYLTTCHFNSYVFIPIKYECDY